MKAMRIQKQGFLSILHLLSKEKTLIDRLHCTVLRRTLNLSTLSLQTYNSFLDQQLT